MARSGKYVFLFEEGKKELKESLGGKGANLAEMTNLGLPIPPGFTITTKACNYFLEHDRRHPPKLKEQVERAISIVEKKTGKRFGGSKNPLLFSVRSGAPVSMPGMMDTILNLGLNERTIKALREKTRDERFVLDLYRRLIQMFGEIVSGISPEKFEKILADIKEKHSIKFDTDLKAKHLREIIKKFLALYKRETGNEFPDNPKKQLFMAIDAVFNSWNNKRAITYRRIHGIPDSIGTAVNIQSMAFGNMDKNSGTGVGFTRNPSTGKKEMFGEFLLKAQGEDIVGGIRTPQPIEKLKKAIPKAYLKLEKIANKLEKHYRDMQDFEFTIESGNLWILQTRTGKRTAEAAVKIAVDMVSEGLISKKEAIMRIQPEHLDKLLHRRINPNEKLKIIAQGLPASPGAASGQIMLNADEAELEARAGKKVILVRPETTPEDIHGVIASQGVLTSRGGMTSHAAVVARGMGKPCVSGCEKIVIDLKKKRIKVNSLVLKEGDIISIDGSTGNVILGEAKLLEPEMSQSAKTLLKWADSFRRLGIRANADVPKDARKARELGAEGIGLCRTEHMFMAKERVPIVQGMILAVNYSERKKALRNLLPMQRNDFYGLFKEMNGLPVVIRLLDPPLHEFLPDSEALLKSIHLLEKGKKKPRELEEKRILYKKAKELSERNPMLGFRGCRLGIIYPEIYEMQVRAIFEAAFQAEKEGIKVKPRIMIPLVGSGSELRLLKNLVLKTANKVMEKNGKRIEFKIGTMIELPRACMVAGEIAMHADFFSFGTNDLTQTTFGFSRDDAEGRFLKQYIEKGILKTNPFIELDRKGVGKLVKIGVKNGKKANPLLSVGLCGEHGGNPNSIEFCHEIGLDYVSCSPFRVPIARLAAAQAAITNNQKKK